jgi:hypothetical protein
MAGGTLRMSKTTEASSRTHGSWTEWSDAELGGAGLGDARLDQRLVAITASFMAAPQASIPRASGDWATSKATYRFLDNSRVDPEIIYERHRQSILPRAAGKAVVLAIADTTMLDYTDHPATAGLGPLGDLVHHGLMLHPTLLVTPEREPLGVIDAQTWIRDVDEFGHGKSARGSRDISEKESRKWLGSLEAAERLQQDLGPGTQVVSVFDREGDVYEVLATAGMDDRLGRILVRAQADRRLLHPQQKIWEYLEAQPVAITMAIEVPKKIRQAGRTAGLSIRFARVTVQPPKDRPKSEGNPPVPIYAVYAREEHPPKDQKPISWMLLTTVPVESPEQAWTIVQWYTCRWLIEILFKVLKTGCAAEERQLETAERLKRCLAIDLVVAWRILYLTMIGRETPDLPCTVVFEDYEWKALYVFVFKSRTAAPAKTPTLREVTRTIGRLGGHLGRKGDGEPGVLTMWRGLQRLPDIAEMWQVLNETASR